MSVYEKESPAAFSGALSSLAVQSRPLNEIVLVVDGPVNSDLDQIITRYQSILPLRTLRLERNVGLPHALNAGLKIAKYPWIMRFDSDDVSVSKRVEFQAEIVESGQYDVFGGQIEEFDQIPGDIGSKREVPCTHNQIVNFALKRCPFNHQTVCYQRDAVLKLGGYPDNLLMQDYALWIRLIKAGARLYNDKRTLALVRVGNGMFNRRGGRKYLYSEIQLQHEMWRLGLKGAGSAVLDGAMRAAVFSSPNQLKKLIYHRLLRSLTASKSSRVCLPDV